MVRDSDDPAAADLAIDILSQPSNRLTRAVKDVPVKQTGYSGLMIPVLEETVLTRRWTAPRKKAGDTA